MACNSHSTLTPSRASITSNFSRRLALLAAAMAPAAALALPEAPPARADHADGALIKAAAEVQAALAYIAHHEAACCADDAALDGAMARYSAAAARLVEAGHPETPAGLAALAAAVLAVLHYEVRLFARKSFEEQAERHEMLAAILAESVAAMGGRTGA